MGGKIAVDDNFKKKILKIRKLETRSFSIFDCGNI